VLWIKARDKCNPFSIELPDSPNSSKSNRQSVLLAKHKDCVCMRAAEHQSNVSSVYDNEHVYCVFPELGPTMAGHVVVVVVDDQAIPGPHVTRIPIPGISMTTDCSRASVKVGT